jgi:hypothetical protein
MQVIRFCRLSVIIGTLCIWSIKWVIRPYFHFAQPGKYLLGIAPNLMGSFLLPLGCHWLLRKHINIFHDIQLKSFCIISFFLLVGNELLQLIPVFGRTFDYNDIGASVIGLILAYAFCRRYLFSKIATYP